MSSVIMHRRNLHQIPELDQTLPKTIAYILSILTPLSCKIETPIPSSVSAFFNFQKTKSIAFRCDMDALPIQEKNQHSFISQHPSMMHACGHDAHMAMILELASYINQCKNLPYNILLLFQPSEETTGGAKLLIDSGILQKYNIDKLFGFHLWPNLQPHCIASIPNQMMACSTQIDIKIIGFSEHGATLMKKGDALACGIKFIHQCMQKCQPYMPSTLFFVGKFQSGFTSNIVSNLTHISATIRSINKQQFQEVKNLISRLLKQACKQHHTLFEISFSDGYPILNNSKSLFHSIQTQIPELETLSTYTLLSDDFAYYTQEVDSIYFFLGIGFETQLHSNYFDFDEKVLETGVKFYKKLLFIDSL